MLLFIVVILFGGFCWDKSVCLCSSNWPGTCYVDQSGPELRSICLYLLSNRFKGLHYHTQLCAYVFLSPQLSKPWQKVEQVAILLDFGSVNSEDSPLTKHHVGEVLSTIVDSILLFSKENATHTQHEDTHRHTCCTFCKKGSLEHYSSS